MRNVVAACVLLAFVNAAVWAEPVGGAGATKPAVESWDFPTHRQFAVPNAVTGLAVCEGGNRFAAVSEHQIVVVDMGTGKIILELKSAAVECHRLKFSADGGVLMRESGTGLFDSRRWIEVWRVKDGKLLFSNHHDTSKEIFGDEKAPQTWDGDLSPDGRKLILTGFYVFDLEKGRGAVADVGDELRRTYELLFAPDGKQIVCFTLPPERRDELNVTVVRAADYHVEATYGFNGQKFLGFADTQGARGGVAPNGKIVVVGPRVDGEKLTMTDLVTGREVETIKPADPLNGLEMFCGGRRVVTTTVRSLVVWDLRKSPPAMELKLPTGEPPEFASEGSLLGVFGGDRTVDVWDFKGRQGKGEGKGGEK